MNDIDQSDFSLRNEFEFCANIIKQLESGEQGTEDLQDRLKQCDKKLKLLTKEVSALSLFNNDESVDELPTSSLNYLFLPYYLATVTQNVHVEPDERLSSLDRAKIYLRDFLRRLKSYNIMDFDLSELNEDNREKETGKPKRDIDPAKQRELKVQRFQQEKNLEKLVRNLESELHSNTDDDELMRELIINRLRLAAVKSMDEMEQIDQERVLVKHMMKIRTGQIEASPKRPMNPCGSTPYIIARDETQKKVFGLGYPSIPTMTVNEWYDNMVKNGRFNAVNRSSSENNPDPDIVDEETVEEQERIRLQRWDEYKDCHRRGWGNTHNKG